MSVHGVISVAEDKIELKQTDGKLKLKILREGENRGRVVVRWMVKTTLPKSAYKVSDTKNLSILRPVLRLLFLFLLILRF